MERSRVCSSGLVFSFRSIATSATGDGTTSNQSKTLVACALKVACDEGGVISGTVYPPFCSVEMA
jgi:hypothetical protein